MTTRPDPLARLQSALDDLLQALRSGHADGVLAVEARLGDAVAAMQADGRDLLSGDSAQTRARLLTLRQTMARCAALGGVMSDLAALSQPARVYRSDGRSQDRPVQSRLLV